MLALIGVAICGLSLLLTQMAHLPAPVLVGAFTLLGFVATGWNGVLLAATAATAPAGRVGSNTGAILVYTFLGAILGPSIFAVTFAATGSYGGCFLLVAGIGAAGAAIALRANSAE